MLSAALQMAAYIIAGRVYGPAGRGTIAAMIAVATFSAAIGGISAGKGVMREACLWGDSINYLRNNYTSILAVCLATTALAAAGVVMLSLVAPTLLGKATGILLLGACVMMFYYIWVPIGEVVFSFINKIWEHTLLGVGGSVAQLIAVCLAGYTYKLPIRAFAVVYAGIAVSSSIVEVILAAAILKPARLPTVRGIAGLAISGAKVHLDTIGGSLITCGGSLVINARMSATSLGLYEMANRLVAAAMLVPTVARRYVIETLGREGSHSRIAALLRRALAVTLCTCLMIALGALLLFRFVLPEFKNAYPYTLGLMLAAPLNAVVLCLSPYWFYRGHYFFVIGSTIALGIFTIFGTAICVERVGVWGAIAIAVIAYGAAAALNLHRYYNMTK